MGKTDGRLAWLPALRSHGGRPCSREDEERAAGGPYLALCYHLVGKTEHNSSPLISPSIMQHGWAVILRLALAAGFTIRLLVSTSMARWPNASRCCCSSRQGPDALLAGMGFWAHIIWSGLAGLCVRLDACWPSWAFASYELLHVPRTGVLEEVQVGDERLEHEAGHSAELSSGPADWRWSGMGWGCLGIAPPMASLAPPHRVRC